jgi:hypothetical protein
MPNAEYVVYDIKEQGLTVNWNPTSGPAVEEAKKLGQRVSCGCGRVKVPQCLDEMFIKAHNKLITDGRIVRRGQSLPRVKAGTKPVEMPARAQGPALSSHLPSAVPAPEGSAMTQAQEAKGSDR